MSEQDSKSGLIGKYFLGFSGGHETGIIEAAVDRDHYLVRCDADRGRPEYLAVVAVFDMAGGDGEGAPPPWVLFENAAARAKYIAWIEAPSEDPPRKFRVVPLKRQES
jgi:hypothetical protein